MAEVFRAESRPVAGISRRVAIKRLLYASEQDPRLADSLLDEARIWVQLQHPNVVQVLDFGEHDGRFFLVLELIEGMSAAEVLRHGGPLPATEALCIAERVARALDYAHGLPDDAGNPLGIVHRDVKLANVLISERGDVKLTDFGIARATDRITVTKTGEVKGSINSMAPEQVRGEPLDGRADLFSLGCLLHALLTGRTLIPAAGAALLQQLAQGRIPPPAEELPANVRRLLSGLLAPSPRDRFARGDQVAREIRTILLPSTPDDAERTLGERVLRLRIARGDDRPSRVSSPAIPPSSRPSPSPPPPPPSPSPFPSPHTDTGAATAVVAAEAGRDDPDGSGAMPEFVLPGAEEPGRASPPQPHSAPPPTPAPASPHIAGGPGGVGGSMDVEIPLSGSQPITGHAAPKADSPTLFHRAFEVLPPGITRRLRRARDAQGRPPIVLMAAFAAALTVLAILAIGPVMGWIERGNCAASRSALAGVLESDGPAAAAANVGAFALRCPEQAQGGLLRARLLAMAGDAAAAEAALPAAPERNTAQRLAAASIRFSEGRFREAEEAAQQLFREDGTGEARCLAAAAAINQDRPERVEAHLRDTFTGCSRLLQAAAVAQRGELRLANDLLRDPIRDRGLQAAYESARAVLALSMGSMEAAAASALSGSSAAGRDPLDPDPWIWTTAPSPRGGQTSALRVTGPFDDPVLYMRMLEGDAARDRGSLDLALKLYDAAIARRGRVAAAEVRASGVLARQGRRQLARARLLRALDADPRHAPALVALAVLDERTDPGRAAGYATSALRLEPDNRDARRIAGAARRP